MGEQILVHTGFPAGPEGPQLPNTCSNVWQQQSIVQKYPMLTSDIRCEVCVIGGGISGLSTAYRLAKAGKRVIVLEAYACASGSSGRGMGMLSQWNNDTYASIDTTAGNHKARIVANAQSATTAWVEGVIKAEGIDCSFHRVPGFVFEAGKERLSSTKAYQEFCACSRAGLAQAKMEHFGCGTGLPTGNLSQGVSFPECANLHPVAYMQGLADAIINAGGKIFEGTRAKGGLVTGPHQGVVQTMNGPTVEARDAVVLATHSPINRDQLWVHDRQLARKLYTIALEVPKGAVQGAQYYDMAGNHQVRLTPMPGSSESEVLLVQSPAEYSGNTGKADPYARLEDWARKFFPPVVGVVSKWSSMDYYPADLLGLYGQDPLDREQPPNYILTGHGGQDLTGATIGSEVVANAVLQLPNPWADAYNPSRVMLSLSAAVKYATELAVYFSRVGIYILRHVTPFNLSDVVGAVSPASVESMLAKGDGMVVQHGWRKKALWKDDDGLLHTKSAVCTHLGCCVSYNALNRTFDCPCHGSSFSGRGQCLHGPAVADLEDLGKF